jgi:hypothetical protein
MQCSFSQTTIAYWAYGPEP